MYVSILQKSRPISHVTLLYLSLFSFSFFLCVCVGGGGGGLSQLLVFFCCASVFFFYSQTCTPHEGIYVVEVYLPVRVGVQIFLGTDLSGQRFACFVARPFHPPS